MEFEFREYHKKDFLTSTEPFDIVYQYHHNRFEMTQAIEQMAALASSVGVKNFKSLFKEYCKEMAHKDSPPIRKNMTNFAGQPFALACGNWIADDAGIRLDTEYGEMVACIHPILPTKRLVNMDHHTEKLELEYCKGGIWRSTIESKRTLASATQIWIWRRKGLQSIAKTRACWCGICMIRNISIMTVSRKSAASGVWVGWKAMAFRLIWSIWRLMGTRPAKKYLTVSNKWGSIHNGWKWRPKLEKQVCLGGYCLPLVFLLSWCSH